MKKRSCQLLVKEHAFSTSKLLKVLKAIFFLKLGLQIFFQRREKNNKKKITKKFFFI